MKFILNSQTLETTQIFFSRTMNKQNIIYLCNVIVLSNGKELKSDSTRMNLKNITLGKIS